MTTDTAPRTAPDGRAWALLALALVSIVGGNIFAATGLFGPSTGEISDANFPIPIIPAGWAFSIWGVIYTALLALGIAQATRWGEARPGLVRARLAFAVNLVFNIAWLYTFAQEWFVLNTFVLVGQLASGLWIYTALGRRRDSEAWLERFIRFGVSVYAGWLTVATTIGTASTLYASGWGGFGWSIEAWTVVLLAAATAIGLTFRVLQRDPVYALVFVWAFSAIALKAQAPALVATAAWIGAGVFALAAIAPLFVGTDRA